MDKDRENLWVRRSNVSKPSLSMTNSDHQETKNDHASRGFGASKRFGSGETSSHGRSNPFNAIAPLSTNNVASPTAGASTAFGLGSGAFASFGSASKTPKTPGTAFDFGKGAAFAPPGPVPASATEKKDKGSTGKAGSFSSRAASLSLPEDVSAAGAGAPGREVPWPLKYTWVIWYRPPTSKNSDYEKSTKALCRMSTAQEFWKVYVHLSRPSALPTVSDYHFFKEGIRPVWEDEENRRGGKWIIRLKKGVSDRYWEDLLLAMIGDQFAEAGEEVCGAVLSVRGGEDVFSIWTKKDGGRNVKIRETIKHVLSLPPDTLIVWKSHDDSIAQRSAIDHARQEKAVHLGSEKRRATLTLEEPSPYKESASNS